MVFQNKMGLGCWALWKCDFHKVMEIQKKPHVLPEAEYVIVIYFILFPGCILEMDQIEELI